MKNEHHEGRGAEILLAITSEKELERVTREWGWTGLASSRMEAGGIAWVVAQGSRTSGLPSDITAIYRRSVDGRLDLEVLLPFRMLTQRQAIVENGRLVVYSWRTGGPLTIDVTLTGYATPSDCAGVEDLRSLREVATTAVSWLDPELPPTPLREWVLALAGPGGAVCWERNDCGEQTGVPEVDARREIPSCLEVRIESRGRKPVGSSSGSPRGPTPGIAATFSTPTASAASPSR